MQLATSKFWLSIKDCRSQASFKDFAIKPGESKSGNHVTITHQMLASTLQVIKVISLL